MTPAKREKFIAALLPKIDALMQSQGDMRKEAIVHGRIGLDEMDDNELCDFALDCYELDEQNFCDECGAPSNDGEGENGLCGNCADRHVNKGTES
jgi:hypothetical protein